MVTYETYREHMDRYNRETAVMSFTVTKHPDYQALLAMGADIIPYMLNDIKNGNGRHSMLSLLREAAGDASPVVPDAMRGKVKQLFDLWLDWGVRKGYLVRIHGVIA